MRAQLVVGRDLILRAAAFQVAFLTAAGVASRMGTAQIAAHQIGLQLWEFTALLLDSFAIAAQSLVGAALGAVRRRPRPARRRWQVARWGCYAGIGVRARCSPPAGALIPRAVHLGAATCCTRRTCCGRGSSAMLPAAGVVFALDGVLIGAGDVGVPAHASRSSPRWAPSRR